MRTQDLLATLPSEERLRAENELLSLEVEHLRSRLGQARQTGISDARLKHLEAAEKTLKEMLRRLSARPLGWFCRIHPEFRALQKKFLRDDGRDCASPEAMEPQDQTQADLL